MILLIAPNINSATSGALLVSSQYLIPIFLAMIFVAALLSSRTRIPHIIILVIFGIAISFLGLIGLDLVNATGFRIDPKLIINFVIPPLIFEAMMNVNYKQFKTVRISALLLATVGVVVSTLIAGSLLMYVAGLSFAVSFLFASLISPTDPAIVVEIFKKLKVPKGLSTLMELESSFNDATGLIVFSSILALVAGIPSISTTGFSNLIIENGVHIPILYSTL
ncbi:MAG TPA: cation:proton antiporter [Nitrososphaeraceae archaeon]|jgi:CPA1 family monovalent cation:H+ antiporter